jgi:hypothetical protein
MPNPIPDFNYNLVLPPYVGKPTRKEDLSPYKCTSSELCERFATSPDRIKILKGFLSFRERLQVHGLILGYQWLDGSFLEDVELREFRPPNDLDVVTIYWNYDLPFQEELMNMFPEFVDSDLSKKNYLLDHYPFDAGESPEIAVDYSRYWIQLFSHNRDSVWKGMLQIDLNTASDDAAALNLLNSILI